MVQLSVTRCSYIAILRVSPVSFAAITLCVASQRVFIIVIIIIIIIVVVVVYVVIDSVRKLLDTPSYWFYNQNVSLIITKFTVCHVPLQNFVTHQRLVLVNEIFKQYVPKAYSVSLTRATCVAHHCIKNL
jgi:hypothetical protein